VTLKRDEDLDSYLRTVGRLLPNIPEPATLNKFISKVKKTYYNNSATVEDGTTDVSVSFYIHFGANLKSYEYRAYY
jgi:hypothetical protein